jgi:hypothetical protein
MTTADGLSKQNAAEMLCSPLPMGTAVSKLGVAVNRLEQPSAPRLIAGFG